MERELGAKKLLSGTSELCMAQLIANAKRGQDRQSTDGYVSRKIEKKKMDRDRLPTQKR